VLPVEDWAEIRRLRRSEELPIKAIARVLGISRNTVRAALASDAPPKYMRKPAGSIVDAVEPQIRELLRVYPTMLATVIAERIGWTPSIRVLSGRGGGAAAGVSAAGPGLAHRVCGREYRAV
jgi:transposase